MFSKIKKVNEYKSAIDKIDIPQLKGEEFIVCSKKRNNKYVYRALAFTLVFIVAITFMVINNVGVATNNDSSFTIVAYAGTTEYNLNENQSLTLPSGYIKNGEFNMQGFYIESSNIKSIIVKASNGSPMISMFGPEETEYFIKHYIGDHSGMDEVYPSSERKGMTICYKSDKEIRDIVKNLPGSDLVEEPNDSNMDKENNNLIEDSLIHEQQFENNNGYTKFYIEWMPELEFLKRLCTNSVEDYSKEKGSNIDITICFNDGTELNKNLDLTFDNEGKLNIQCNN